MKKMAIISFVLFYASFNIGMVVNFHFCSEALRGLSLIVSPGNCCDGDCPGCQNSSYQLTINDDYDSPVLTTFFDAPAFSTATLPDLAATLLFAGGQGQNAIHTGPLLQSARRPIYLATRAFRI